MYLQTDLFYTKFFKLPGSFIFFYLFLFFLFYFAERFRAARRLLDLYTQIPAYTMNANVITPRIHTLLQAKRTSDALLN